MSKIIANARNDVRIEMKVSNV